MYYFPLNVGVYNQHEKSVLNQFFSCNPYPTYEVKAEIARMLGIEHTRVDDWFKNERQRARNKRTFKTQSIPFHLGKIQQIYTRNNYIHLLPFGC